MSVRFSDQVPPSIPARISELLPMQGSIELQNDRPGKVHAWHFHSLKEELFVVSGKVLLFWIDGDGYHQRACTAGTHIALPAETVHGSVAGADGAVYIISPEGGRTAETTFLAAADHPRPVPEFE